MLVYVIKSKKKENPQWSFDRKTIRSDLLWSPVKPSCLFRDLAFVLRTISVKIQRGNSKLLVTKVAYFTNQAVTRIKYQSANSSFFLFFICWVWWHFVKLSILLPLPSWLIDWSVDTICLKNPQPLPWLLVQFSVETHSIKK